MIEKSIVIGIFTSILWYTLFYIISVCPAQLEIKIGEKAYKRCTLLRRISFVGMGISMVLEVVYFFIPLDMGLPLRLLPEKTGWIASVAIGLFFTVFATIIIKKVSYVAPDSFAPQKKNKMFNGIYDRIRHPQAIADVSYWFAFAFLFNSTFLLIVAIIWIPINYIIVLVEEKDLKIRYGQAYVDYMKRTNRFVPKRTNN